MNDRIRKQLTLLFKGIVILSLLLIQQNQVFPDTYTVITVIEGKTVVFEYPEAEGLKIEVGIFNHQVSQDTALVLVGAKKEKQLCYLTDSFKYKYLTKIKPEIPVLLQENPRSDRGTSWDIIDMGLIVTQGEEYSKGDIYPAEVDKLRALEKEVEAIKGYIYEGIMPSISIDTYTERVAFAEETTTTPHIIPSETTTDGGTTDGGTTDGGTTDGTTPSTPTFYWVNPVNGQDSASRNGSNEQPWKTITYALTRVSSGTINCVAGTYNTASGETFPLTMKSNVTLTGAGSGSTIISASGAGARVILCSSISNITIQSLRITAGNFSGSGSGIYIASSSSITISNCRIDNNTATEGAGIYVDNNSSGITISSCTIDNNSATSGSRIGGGIYIDRGSTTISSTNIYSNSAQYGAGLYFSMSGANTLTMTSSNIYSNSCNDYGGGIYISNGAGSTGSASITSTNIYSNSLSALIGAAGGGGGIYISGDSTASISFTKCSIYSNSLSGMPYQGAAGLLSSTVATSINFTNCLIYTNDSNGANGNGFFCSSSSPSFINCTFSADGDTGEAGEIQPVNNSDPTITNCIFYTTTGYGVYEGGADSDPTINNCDFSGTSATLYMNEGPPNPSLNTVAEINALAEAENNIASDPSFKSGSYLISSGSPCINAGTAAGAPSDDYAGRSRSGLPDIGAYEFISGDPMISGKVYDSLIGEVISSPTISIYKADTTVPLSTTTSNPYSFNVEPGRYYIAVSKDGYGFPSQILSSVVSGDHGDIFTAGDTALNIDIPIDNDGYLVLTKTSNKQKVSIGEIITYNIKIENRHWYRSIPNIVVIDEITNGFKYINGSTYLGRAKQSDPNISNRKASFNLGTVTNNTTLNLSYQIRVSTGIPPGRYKTAVVAKNSFNGKQKSNISSVTVEVTGEPLFDKGTIIGKVFWDEDGDGQQSEEEIGIPNVQIATEYGIVVETDFNGKYHIPNVPPGQHILKVNPESLPSGLTFTTENPYLVKITPGLLAKVNFGLKTKEDIREENQYPESKFFIVALGEGIVRNVGTSGNIEMAEKDNRFDNGISLDGRLSLYLKGKILGKYLITASLDTDRLAKRPNDQQTLFTNLDPDKYYPIYGDASRIDYSATNTQDMLYLLVEWDESMAKWGSFHTEIPLYNRSLSGGNIVYQSKKRTKFDQPYTKIQGFYAISRQIPAHDEFVGTGGSLYYLRHPNVIEGSEKIRVEIRDRISKTPIITIPLLEEKDYAIDYDTGRILLKKPLNLINQAYSSSIISNDILAGERTYLIVDYEYFSSSGMSNESTGGRVSQWFGSHIRVGGTYIRENKEPDPYQLKSGDATIKINKDTEVNATYSRSDETQLGGNISYTGGLTFTEKSNNFADGKHGNAFSINGRTRLLKNTHIEASYSRQDPFYSATDSLTTQGTQKYIARIITELTKNLTMGIQHITQKLLENTAITSALTGNSITYTTTAFLDYFPQYPNKWDWRVEYQHQEVSNQITQFTYLGQLQFNDNDFVAARLGYQLTPRIHPYIRGQTTATGIVNNQVTLGSDLKLWDSTFLNIAETIGNLGNSTLLGLTSLNSNGTETYANIETGNNIQLGKYTRSVYGQASQLSPNARTYIEEDYSTYGENLIRSNLIGYDIKLTNTTSLGLVYERAFIENNTNVINRDAVSTSLSYLNIDSLDLFSKLEYRNDRNSANTTHNNQWLTQNKLHWYITKNLSTFAKAAWSISQDKKAKQEQAEFYDTGIGLAYRPINFDRLNLLAKYNYITDLKPASQDDFPETTESIKNIYGIEGVLDLFRYLQFVGKFALRAMSDRVGYRDWIDSNTHLYIARTNFHITKTWDIAAEYRILNNPDSNDSRAGWLLEIDRDIGNYIRLGVGYNFTDYDDDLSDDDSWDAKGWFVRASGKY